MVKQIDRQSDDDSVEEFARRLYGLDSPAGAIGAFLVSRQARHDIVTSWDEADTAVKKRYRSSARRTLAERKPASDDQ